MVEVHRYCGKCNQHLFYPIDAPEENIVCPRCGWKLRETKCPTCGQEIKP